MNEEHELTMLSVMKDLHERLDNLDLSVNLSIEKPFSPRCDGFEPELNGQFPEWELDEHEQGEAGA